MSNQSIEQLEQAWSALANNWQDETNVSAFGANLIAPMKEEITQCDLFCSQATSCLDGLEEPLNALAGELAEI